MQIRTLPLGPFETNTYLVWNQERETFIIDPGSEPAAIGAALGRDGLTPRAILLTHAHFDHIGAVGVLAERYAIPVLLDPADVFIYDSPANAMEPYFPRPTGLPPTRPALPDAIAGIEFEILRTPGHTPGGISFYFPAAATVFTGDALFCGGVGRTDLPGGDWETLMRSLCEVLFALPPATVVYPGHGPETTIGDELDGNPYVGGGA